MSILKTVFRRILIRQADNAISTSGRNFLISLEDYNPSFPSIKRLVKRVLIFTILNFLLIKLFLLFRLTTMAYLTPLLFIWTILSPFITKHIYNRKQQAITVKDRRNSSGYRTVAYKFVKDKSDKIYFSDSQLQIARIEGILKLCLAALLIFFVYSQANSNEFKVQNLTEYEIGNLATTDDTLIAKNSKTLAYVKVKMELSNNKDKIKKYDTSFIPFESNLITYKFKSSQIGTFLFIDSSSHYSTKYVAIKPFDNINSNSTLQSNKTRIDSFFYVLLSDITIKTINEK